MKTESKSTNEIHWEIAVASGDISKAEIAHENVIDYLAKTEKQLHRVFDYYVFRNTFKNKIHQKLVDKIK